MPLHHVVVVQSELSLSTKKDGAYACGLQYTQHPSENRQGTVVFLGRALCEDRAWL